MLKILSFFIALISISFCCTASNNEYKNEMLEVIRDIDDSLAKKDYESAVSSFSDKSVVNLYHDIDFHKYSKVEFKKILKDALIKTSKYMISRKILFSEFDLELESGKIVSLATESFEYDEVWEIHYSKETYYFSKEENEIRIVRLDLDSRTESIP